MPAVVLRFVRRFLGASVALCGVVREDAEATLEVDIRFFMVRVLGAGLGAGPAVAGRFVLLVALLGVRVPLVALLDAVVVFALSLRLSAGEPSSPSPADWLRGFFVRSFFGRGLVLVLVLVLVLGLESSGMSSICPADSARSFLGLALNRGFVLALVSLLNLTRVLRLIGLASSVVAAATLSLVSLASRPSAPSAFSSTSSSTAVSASAAAFSAASAAACAAAAASALINMARVAISSLPNFFSPG